MLQTHLPRSQAALKRHDKRIGPIIADLRRNAALGERTDLELVLYALGDESTRKALGTYWRQGGDHPVTTMVDEDVRALDRSIAQAIVLAATCDPSVSVRAKTPGRRSKS